MSNTALRITKVTFSLLLAATLSIALCHASAIADSGKEIAVGEAALSATTGLPNDAALKTKASQSSYWVKTKDYRFKIPKFWRGKVQWKTTAGRYQNKWGGWDKHYRTEIYLKGHKGDKRYLLTSVISEAITGFGSGFDPVITRLMKLQDNAYVNNNVVILSKNWPYFIWYAQSDPNWRYYLPASAKAQKKLLKLSTFNKVTYAKAKKGSNYSTKNYKAVKKQQKKRFKSSFKVLR